MAYGKYSILFSETVWNALKKFWIILFNTARKIAGNLNHYMHNLLQISFHTKNKFHTLLCKEKKATNCDTFKWRAYHKQKHCSKSNSWHTGTSFALTKQFKLMLFLKQGETFQRFFEQKLASGHSIQNILTSNFAW